MDARKRQRYLRFRTIERLHLSNWSHRLLFLGHLGSYWSSESLFYRQDLLWPPSFLLDRSLDAGDHVADLEVLEESRWKW